MVRARLLAAVTAVCAVAAPVAVAAWTPGGGDHFWLTAGAGSGAVPFAEGGEVGAAVPAPGGHTIAFATTEGIVIWDADRATATRVAPSSDSSFPPAWSPDGSQLAVEVPRGVEVVGADGTGDHLVPYRASNIDEVAWATPHRLLMNVRKGSGATTARRLLLVDTRTWAQSLLPWRNTKQAAPLTGDRFVAIRESPRPLGTTSLSVLSTDGASAHWLSGPDGVARFAVAPGATRIAAVTEGEEGRALWLLRTNGPPRRLGSWNSLEGDPEAPKWSADGRTLLYEHAQAGRTFEYVSQNGGGLKRYGPYDGGGGDPRAGRPLVRVHPVGSNTRRCAECRRTRRPPDRRTPPVDRSHVVPPASLRLPRGGTRSDRWRHGRDPAPVHPARRVRPNDRERRRDRRRVNVDRRGCRLALLVDSFA